MSSRRSSQIDQGMFSSYHGQSQSPTRERQGSFRTHASANSFDDDRTLTSNSQRPSLDLSVSDQQPHAVNELGIVTHSMRSSEYGVSTFGSSTDGRLGNRIDDLLVSRVEGIPMQTVKQVACGDKITLVLLASGQLWAWGNGNDKPLRLSRFKKRVVYIAAGMEHFCAITEDKKNNLYTWGNNEFGQLGHGNTTNAKYPRSVRGDLFNRTIAHVACGSSHTLCVTTEGFVFGWGRNDMSQVGVEATDAAITKPTLVRMLGKTSSDAMHVQDMFRYKTLMLACGQQHSVAWVSDQDGSLMTAKQQDDFLALEESNTNYRQEIAFQRDEIKKLKQELQQLKSDFAEPTKRQTLLSGQAVRQTMTQVTVTEDNTHNPDAQEEPPTLQPQQGAVQRDLSADSVITEIDRVMIFVERRAQSEDENIRRIAGDLEKLNSEFHRLSTIIKENDQRVRVIWDSVKTYQLQIDEMRINNDESTKQQVVALARQVDENKTIAKAGENGIALHLQDLNVTKKQLDDIRVKERGFAQRRDNWRRIGSLLAKLRKDRVSLLQTKYVETRSDEFIEINKATHGFLEEFRNTAVDRLAASSDAVEQLKARDGRDPGLFELVALSNKQIDTLLSEVEVHFSIDYSAMSSHHDDNVVDDAAHAVIDTTVSSLKQVAQLRREINELTLGGIQQANFTLAELANHK